MPDDLLPASPDTSFIAKAGVTGESSTPRDSQIAGLSVRSIVTLMVTATLCLHTFARIYVAISSGTAIGDVMEPFYGISYVVIGYYFGSAKQGGKS